MVCTDPETNQVLAEMFLESTGTHFLDSGMAYGRAWQRNQSLFALAKEANPELTEQEFYEKSSPYILDFRYGEIDMTLNTFHFLSERLSYRADLQEQFEAYIEEIDPDQDKHYTELSKMFLESLDARGFYGEGDPIVNNTYNDENMLSADFIYCMGETEEGGIAIIQIHGGCDVRGGYTSPKIFEVDNGIEYMMDYAQGYMGCNQCETLWYTDDSYHWYDRNGVSWGSNQEGIKELIEKHSIEIEEALFNEIRQKVKAYMEAPIGDLLMLELKPVIEEGRETGKYRMVGSLLEEIIDPDYIERLNSGLPMVLINEDDTTQALCPYCMMDLLA